MGLYRCNECFGLQTRDSEKKWIKSYCENTGKNARLYPVTFKWWLKEFHEHALGKFHYPDGEKLTLKEIKKNFNEGLIEAFNEGQTPYEALENELESSQG